MTRTTAVFKPSDFPGTPDAATKASLKELFDYLFPGQSDPQIDRSHIGFAVTAQNPQLALNLAKLSSFVARDMPWCHRKDLRELTIQVLNLHYKCESSFEAHVLPAQAAGIGPELQAAIPYWRTTTLFNDEQRLVVEYTFAVVAGDVPDALFARVVHRYGETGAIEFTTAVALWSFWAMILNATTRTDAKPARG